MVLDGEEPTATGLDPAVGAFGVADVNQGFDVAAERLRDGAERLGVGFSPPAADARDDGVERVAVELRSDQGPGDELRNRTVREQPDGSDLGGGPDRRLRAVSRPYVRIERGDDRPSRGVFPDVDAARAERRSDVRRQRDLRTLGRVDVGFAEGSFPVVRDRNVARTEFRRDRPRRIRRAIDGDERAEEVERDCHAGWCVEAGQEAIDHGKG